jgi:hypothetical protein
MRNTRLIREEILREALETITRMAACDGSISETAQKIATDALERAFPKKEA